MTDAEPRHSGSTASIVGGIALVALLVLAVVGGLAVYSGWMPWQNADIDVPKLEQTLEDYYDEQGFPADIDCPDSMQAERGTTNDCIATFGDNTTARVEVRWQNDDGEYVASIAQ